MNWEYLAGFVDGEGTLCITRYLQNGNLRFAPIFSISNTNKEVSEQIRDFLTGAGARVVFCAPGKREARYVKHYGWSIARKPLYHVRVQGKEIRKVIDQISEGLVVKREQAQVMKEFLPLVGETGTHLTAAVKQKMSELADKMAMLNR